MRIYMIACAYGVLAILLICLGGCASATKKIGSIMAPLTHVDQVSAEFGRPQAITELSENQVEHIWETQRTVVVPGRAVYERMYRPRYVSWRHHGRRYSDFVDVYVGSRFVGFTPDREYDKYCLLRVVADKEGRIRTWDIEGDDCSMLLERIPKITDGE